MPNNRPRRSDCPAPMIESLEPRLLLSAPPQTFVDWDGDRVTVSLNGPGSMVIEEGIEDVDVARIKKITLIDVEGSQTTLSIKVARAGGNGFVDVGRITGGANCGLHALDAATTNIVGTATLVPLDPDGDGSGYGIDLEGYVKTINLHNITNGVDVRIKQGAYYFPTCIPTTFTAWDIGQDTTVTLGSWVEALKVHSWDVGGSLDAKGLTKLDAAGNFGADITLFRGPTAGPITIGGSVLSTVGKPTDWDFPTDVGAITVGSGTAYWSITADEADMPSLTCKGNLSFGTIQALSLAKLSVTGDLPVGALVLTQAVDPVKMALGAATIGGTLGDTTQVAGAPVWTISGNVGAIVVGASSDDWRFEATGAVKSMTCKGDMGFGHWLALSLGTLAVTGDQTSGSMDLTQPVDPKKLALGSASIGGEVGNPGFLSWTIVGNVGAMTIGSSAGNWSADIEGNVASLTVKGNMVFGGWQSLTLGTLKVAGDMTTGVMRLQSASTSSNSITIGGWLDHSTIRAAGSIGSFKAKGMNYGNVFAGVDPLGGTGQVTNFSARIGTVTVTGQATPWASHWMMYSEIRMGILGSAFIQGPLSGSGNVFAVRTIVKNTLRIRRYDGVSYSYDPDAIGAWPLDRLNVVIL
jgi:hypothetical protein